MDLIDKLKSIDLFDLYGSLLTDGRREVMARYLYDDCALSEIATDLNQSRQAVYDAISSSEKQLARFEEKLGFLAARQLVRAEIDACLDESDLDKIKARLNKIKNNL